MSDELLVQAAVLGPAVSGAVWLVLALVRWPWVRRTGGGLTALAGHTAAWAVLWQAYRGGPPAWRSFEPDLLGASVAVAAEVAVLLAAVRADPLGRRWAPAAVCGLAVAASAVVGTAYAQSLAVQAVLLPIPTLAAAAAALTGGTRPDLRGLLGLAGADVVGLVGLSVIFARAGTTTASSEAGVLGGALVVAAGAVKAGAVPGLGTWRLASTDGPGAPVTAALRGQGVALAVLGGITIAAGEPLSLVVGLAATAVLVAGAASVAGRGSRGAAAAISGASAGLLFVALGLGGAVGIRAALVLFPAFLLGAGAAFLLTWERRPDDELPSTTPEPRKVWRWMGSAVAAVVLLSLTGLPPGGGFPGAWLTLSLTGARGLVTAPHFLAAGAVGLGLCLAALGGIPVVRAARTRVLPALIGVVVAGVLLYMGLQPVRLGIGWWLRIERQLAVPEVLAASGAPDLPPVGGLNLAVVLAEAVLLVGAVVVLGRGFRDVRTPFVAISRPRPGPFVRVDRTVRSVKDRLGRLGTRRVGPIAAAVVEAVAIGLAVRLVVVTSQAGFL
jgi:Proton-conducting membrane transporter